MFIHPVTPFQKINGHYLVLLALLVFPHTLGWTQSTPELEKEVVRLIDESYKEGVDSAACMKLANLALEKANESGLLELRAKAHVNLGRIYKYYLSLNASLEEYEKAIELFKKAGKKEELPEVYRVVGRIYYEVADYTVATDYYLKSINISKELNLKGSTQAWTYRYLGSVYKRQKDYERALEYYEKSYVLFKELEDHDGMASALNTRGIVYGKLGNKELELLYFKQALKICEKHGLMGRGTIIIGNIGNVYSDIGRYDQAIKYHELEYEMLTEEEDEGDSHHIALNFCNRALVMIKLENYALAEEYLGEAVKSAKKSPLKQKLTLTEIYNRYSQLYKRTGDYKAALEYDELSDSLDDILVNAQIGADMEGVSFKYERARLKEKAEADKKLEQQKSATQRIWIGSLILGFIGVLVFGVFIYRQKQKLQGAYKSLVARNLELAKTQTTSTPQQKETVKQEPKLVTKDVQTNGEEKKYAKSALSQTQKDALLEKIIERVEGDKLFMDNSISVNRLADILETNKSYISQVINEGLQKNFSTFINEYRIQEARKMLADKENKHLTIEAIARTTGFKSISSFNTAFKKYTGLTPSYFLRSVGGNNG